jgi:hypothetical protein
LSNIPEANLEAFYKKSRRGMDAALSQIISDFELTTLAKQFCSGLDTPNGRALLVSKIGEEKRSDPKSFALQISVVNAAASEICPWTLAAWEPMAKSLL